MICPYQAKLIPLVAGHLSAQDADDVQAHAATCSSCSEKLAELRATWHALGAWEISAPNRDLAPTVLAAARAADNPFTQLRRMAAAIILAGGAGVAAALLMPAPTRQIANGPPHVQVASAPGDDELIQAMSLDSLATDPAAFDELFDTQFDEQEGSL